MVNSAPHKTYRQNRRTARRPGFKRARARATRVRDYLIAVPAQDRARGCMSYETHARSQKTALSRAMVRYGHRGERMGGSL